MGKSIQWWEAGWNESCNPSKNYFWPNIIIIDSGDISDEDNVTAIMLWSQCWYYPCPLRCHLFCWPLRVDLCFKGRFMSVDFSPLSIRMVACYTASLWGNNCKQYAKVRLFNNYTWWQPLYVINDEITKIPSFVWWRMKKTDIWDYYCLPPWVVVVLFQEKFSFLSF